MANGNSDALLIDVTDGIARVTMNRPEVHNAFDENLIALLDKAFLDLGENPDVWIIVLAGAGKSFSAGADLNWMKRMAGFSRAENVDDAHRLAALMHRIDTCPKPTLALVQGAALAGGIGLVATCDIAIATRDTRFAISEVRLGLIPSVISPYVLNAIGPQAARRYFLTAERFDAAEAQRLGLVHEIVAPEELEAAGKRMIDVLAGNAPGAMSKAKALIAHVAGKPVDNGLMNETAQRIADARASEEGREGVTAFLEKRTPTWR